MLDISLKKDMVMPYCFALQVWLSITLQSKAIFSSLGVRWGYHYIMIM